MRSLLVKKRQGEEITAGPASLRPVNSSEISALLKSSFSCNSLILRGN
jgi:hypothetical protein